ncbi:MAG: ATP-binding protein [Actinomycetota bacterium]|nr:ATP-binding protein [Actinomycetota bacterium]
MKERDLERKARVAQLLLDAARTLGETLDPDRVYDRFHDLLSDVVQHDGVLVSSYDERDGLIRCDYAWSDGNRLDTTVFPPLPLNRKGGGMQSQVIVSGVPRLFNDVADVVQRPGGTYYDVDREGTVRKLPDSGPPGSRAAMMVPVKHEGQVVGVVQVMSNSAEYLPEQLELVDGLVGQMAAAVRNARLQKEQVRLEAAAAAARAVAAERVQAANVLDAVGDGIFLVDGEGVVRLWNRAAALVTGCSANEVSGGPIVDVFPEWTAFAARIPIAEHGAAAQAATLPARVGTRDLWLSFVAVRSADGIVYAFRDLTSERRLEEEKSDFVATISHELRTPMAAVYGAAQTLLNRDHELTPEQKHDLLEMVATQAARLGQITEAVLLTTQLDQGSLAVEPEPVDVGALTRATVDAMRSQLPPSAEVEIDVAPEVGAASGAQDRIQQVLVNLLDNAVKYGGDGPVSIRVEPANGAVRILVADSGPGIPFEEQRRIFEKFYRSGPELTRATGGTGLGLYISRELVQRMGGRLEVRSQPGAGATFIVELPRAAP